jgi:AraC family transcriptional regulator, ethanolamine operon transcriptional activator
MVERVVTFEPPAVTVVEISDPAAANAGIELIDVDAVQLQATPFRARRVIVRLEAATVVFHATNVRMRTRTRVLRDLLAYVAFGPQTRGTVNGLAVRPGLLLAAESEAELALVTDAHWESLAFLLAPQEIRAHLTARQRAGTFRLPLGVEALQADAEQVQRLFDWGKRLLDVATEQPGVFNERRQERAAAQVELFEHLLSTLGGAEDFEPTRIDRTRQTQSRIVKVAEEYALSKVGEPLYVTDLCKATSTGERTLEYAFKDVMGLAPVTYLIRLRLHRVREALSAATAESTTVSAEALNWGFWHFGEFSRAYKDCFGELPSDTLRRSPSQQTPLGRLTSRLQ